MKTHGCWEHGCFILNRERRRDEVLCAGACNRIQLLLKLPMMWNDDWYTVHLNLTGLSNIIILCRSDGAAKILKCGTCRPEILISWINIFMKSSLKDQGDKGFLFEKKNISVIIARRILRLIALIISSLRKIFQGV